ncbi:hypothetical protein HPB47_001757 [Ixodes persulcatus]|uniref:Uncharacterized protein n=1 Tax=Ixodes persulcatus TaxID=34615 RepID=A0AC60PN41_IXOPE|nr:hypothetical protein HPB47_001757 [Ixodes persulcatus]
MTSLTAGHSDRTGSLVRETSPFCQWSKRVADVEDMPSMGSSGLSRGIRRTTPTTQLDEEAAVLLGESGLVGDSTRPGPSMTSGLVDTRSDVSSTLAPLVA